MNVFHEQYSIRIPLPAAALQLGLFIICEENQSDSTEGRSVRFIVQIAAGLSVFWRMIQIISPLDRFLGGIMSRFSLRQQGFGYGTRSVLSHALIQLTKACNLHGRNKIYINYELSLSLFHLPNVSGVCMASKIVFDLKYCHRGLCRRRSLS